MRIAVVEDNSVDAGLLQDCLERYAGENNKQLFIHRFPDGLSFISDYKADFDVVFLDIKMPSMNGFDIAKLIRDVDNEVCIIFVTTMAQFAIKGYEVNALDYMIKPVEYHNLADKMKRAERQLTSQKQTYVVAKTNETILKFNAANIIYIEKDKNYLVYHMADGEYRIRGTLSEAEDQLLPVGFAKCTHGCIVNLRYVTSLGKSTLEIEGHVLPISRRDRKEFVDRLIAFCGGTMSNGI